MPAYELMIAKGATQFEVECRMDERRAKAVCPKCGSHKVSQRLSADFSLPRPRKY